MGNYLPTANRTIRVKDDPLSSVLHAYRDRTSHTQAARFAAPGSDAPGSCAATSSVTIAQVRDVYATYADLFPGHNKLDADQFDQVFGSVFGDTDPHFSAWAAGPGGVPILQVFVGIAIHCQGDLAQRSDLVFDVYDLDGSGSMAADEVVMLLQDALRAMCRMAGTRPALDSECLLGAQMVAHGIIQQAGERPQAIIHRDDFTSWATSDVDVALYVDGFTMHTEVRVASVQMRMVVLGAMDRFDGSASRVDGSVHMAAAEYQLNALLVRPLSPAEIDLLHRHDPINGSTRCQRATFEVFARSLVIFRIVSKDTDRPLPVSQVESLVWLLNGFQPSPHRLRAEVATLGIEEGARIDHHAAPLVDRLTWLRAQCSDAKVDERLYEEFDRYDQDHSGKLSLAEVSEMLFDTMARDNIGVEVIKASSQASQLMRSMVGALAAEIVDEIDADGDQHVTWPELRSRWAHVKQRRDALARWILDYNLTFVSRYFAFDADGNACLDELEIQAALLQRMRPLVLDGTVTMAEANDLVRQTTGTIIEVSDKDHNGTVSIAEFTECAQRIASVEADMMLRARHKKVDRLANAAYAAQLPKAKIAIVSRLASLGKAKPAAGTAPQPTVAGTTAAGTAAATQTCTVEAEQGGRPPEADTFIQASKRKPKLKRPKRREPAA
ncbi:EF-hand domain-containing protein [Plasmodiophora brassicae]